MRFVKHIEILIRQQKEIEKEVYDLNHKLKDAGWEFCTHLHYNKPKISARKTGGVGKSTLFVIKQTGVEMLKTGKYIDSWHEAETILNGLLPQKFNGRTNLAERIIDLGKLEQKLKERIDVIQASLNSESTWLFCLHGLYCDEPRIIAGKLGDDSDECASFVVEEGKVKILTTGMYGSRCHEARSILTEWTN